MLNTSQLEEYRAKLEKERMKLLAEVEKENVSPEFGSDVEDMSEEADEAEELGNNLSVAAALKERINEIDAALNRITKGEYGMCEMCHEAIDAAQLDAVPESRLCISCKQK